MPRGERPADEEEAQGLLGQTPEPLVSTSNKNNGLQIGAGLVALVLALAGLYGLSRMFASDKLHIAPLKFSVVDGFFVQSSGQDVADVYNESTQFGIVDADWASFRRRVDDLVKNAKPDEAYKVLFNARHGQGFHNVKEAEVGTELWDCKWSLLETDGNITWGPDPRLSDLGEQQAECARDAWTQQLARGAPMPEVYLSSPFQRSARTAEVTWSDKKLPSKVQIWELWREMIGLHTCDKRGTRSYLEKTFPSFDIEPDLTEEDGYWSKDLQEPQIAQDYRIHTALQRLFAEFPNATYVYTASHSGSITGVKHSVGHVDTFIQTGGMLPVVIKAEPDIVRHPPRDAWNTAPPCPQ